MGGKFTSGERRGLIVLLIIVSVVWAAVAFTRQCGRGTYTPPSAESAITARADTLRDTVQKRHSAPRTTRRAKKSPDKPSSAAGRQRSFLDEDIPVKQQ